MDPSGNPAQQSAKLSSLQHTVHRPHLSSPLEEDMPPAYHMVVDPNMPIPNLTSPYDEDEADAEKEDDTNDTPDITINASTQIRGSGNIVSIAQMDSVRIATLITSLLENSSTPSSETPSMSAPVAEQERTTTSRVRGVRRWANVNITVNCGATVIGDRNIVGPGLGDVARQVQMAQRNQALKAQQAQKMGMGVNGVQTPPMSRSGSAQSEGKRKAEEFGEGGGKRQC
jgi:hypothetical protein